MIFKCTIKYNGVYYPPGTDVPMGETTAVTEDKKETPETVVVEESVVRRGRKKVVR